MKKLYRFVLQFLHRPVWVIIACGILMSAHIVFDGTLWQIYSLSKNRKVLELRIDMIHKKNKEVEGNLKKLSSDSSFLEKEARDRLNLAGENDLIFLFPEEEELTPPRE